MPVSDAHVTDDHSAEKKVHCNGLRSWGCFAERFMHDFNQINTTA